MSDEDLVWCRPWIPPIVFIDRIQEYNLTTWVLKHGYEIDLRDFDSDEFTSSYDNCHNFILKIPNGYKRRINPVELAGLYANGELDFYGYKARNRRIMTEFTIYSGTLEEDDAFWKFDENPFDQYTHCHFYDSDLCGSISLDPTLCSYHFEGIYPDEELIIYETPSCESESDEEDDDSDVDSNEEIFT